MTSGLPFVNRSRLTTRIAAAASSLALVLMLVVGVLSYQFSREQLLQSMGLAVESEAALLADAVTNKLNAMTSTISPLAGNALIINSLMDSFTRDTSLAPFLQDFGGVHGIPVAVALTDFEGATVVSTPEPVSSTADWKPAVLTGGEAFVALQSNADGYSVLVAVPVHLPGTHSPEGALLYEVPIDALMIRGPEHVVGATMVRLSSRGEEIVAHIGPDLADVVDGNPLRRVRSLFTNAPLDRLGLAIEVVADPAMLTEPLRTLSRKYYLLGVLVVTLVLVLSIIMARYLTQPLRRLESVASSIIDSGSFDERFKVTGMPEVVGLGDAFNRMLDRLTGAYRELARTAEDEAARHEALAKVNIELEKEIAERQHAETELARHATELSRSNAELESFAYVASHDLHEPLRKVQAFGGLLEKEIAGVASPAALDYIGRMRNASARMQALIDDLLLFSRVAAPRTVSSKADLSEIFDEVVSNLEIALKDNDAVVECDALPIVACDAVHMRQLFQNLVGNSLKYRRDDVAPVVRIACAPPRTDSGAAAGHEQLCEFTVQDNGIGFEQKYAERVFGVFQRLHGRSEYEGTGIGLAICRKIVDYYGGRISARSTPGSGTAFVFTLPLAEGQRIPRPRRGALPADESASLECRAC